MRENRNIPAADWHVKRTTGVQSQCPYRSIDLELMHRLPADASGCIESRKAKSKFGLGAIRATVGYVRILPNQRIRNCLAERISRTISNERPPTELQCSSSRTGAGKNNDE